MTKISVKDLKMSYLNQPNVVYKKHSGDVRMPEKQSLQFLNDLEKYEKQVTDVTEWAFYPEIGTCCENMYSFDLSPEEMTFRESIQKARDFIAKCMKNPFRDIELDKAYKDFITLFSIYTLDD